MKGSLQIAKFYGIPVFVHWSFGLIFFGVLYIAQSVSLDWKETLTLTLGMLVLFTCVVLHEYGHALTARRFGVKTRDIILLPIGGVARLEKLPEKPIHEFLIAIAGPLVNIAIAIVLSVYFLFVPFSSIPKFTSQLDFILNSSLYIPGLIFLNLVLAIFNLIPAFPMDGGRILRSLLSIKLGRKKATWIASVLGQFLAVGFIIAAIFLKEFSFGLIGVFVFLTASQEYKMVKLDTALLETKAKDLIRKEFTRLLLSDVMNKSFQELKNGLEKNFLVFDEMNQVLGVLHEPFIDEALKQNDGQALVAEYTSGSFEKINSEESLKIVVERFQENGYSILPIYEEENLVGVIDITMLNQFLKSK